MNCGVGSVHNMTTTYIKKSDYIPPLPIPYLGMGLHKGPGLRILGSKTTPNGHNFKFPVHVATYNPPNHSGVI